MVVLFVLFGLIEQLIDVLLYRHLYVCSGDDFVALSTDKGSIDGQCSTN